MTVREGAAAVHCSLTTRHAPPRHPAMFASDDRFRRLMGFPKVSELKRQRSGWAFCTYDKPPPRTSKPQAHRCDLGLGEAPERAEN